MRATHIEALLICLSQAEVEFVVIGGAAALAHGSARVTFDVDVCYQRAPENIQRLCAALAPLRPALRGAEPGLPFKFDVATVTAGLNFTLTTELGDLDLLGDVSGLGEYEAVRAASEELVLYGRPMRVLTLEGLLKAKRAAARRKDEEAIVELEALLELRKRPPP
jgi:predicted nucleotidyltransferase